MEQQTPHSATLPTDQPCNRDLHRPADLEPSTQPELTDIAQPLTDQLAAFSGLEFDHLISPATYHGSQLYGYQPTCDPEYMIGFSGAEPVFSFRGIAPPDPCFEHQLYQWPDLNAGAVIGVSSDDMPLVWDVGDYGYDNMYGNAPSLDPSSSHRSGTDSNGVGYVTPKDSTIRSGHSVYTAGATNDHYQPISAGAMHAPFLQGTPSAVIAPTDSQLAMDRGTYILDMPSEDGSTGFGAMIVGSGDVPGCGIGTRVAPVAYMGEGCLAGRMVSPNDTIGEDEIRPNDPVISSVDSTTPDQPNRLLWSLCPTANPPGSKYSTAFHLVGAIANAEPGVAEQLSASGLSIIRQWVIESVPEGKNVTTLGEASTDGSPPSYYFSHFRASPKGINMHKEVQRALSAQLVASCPGLSTADYVHPSHFRRTFRKLANESTGQGTVTALWQAATEAQHYMDDDTYHPFPVFVAGRCCPDLQNALASSDFTFGPDQTSKKRKRTPPPSGRSRPHVPLRFAHSCTSVPIFTSPSEKGQSSGPRPSIAVTVRQGGDPSRTTSRGCSSLHLCGWTNWDDLNSVRWLQERGPQLLASSVRENPHLRLRERSKRIAKLLKDELTSAGVSSIDVATTHPSDIRKKVRRQMKSLESAKATPVSLLWGTNSAAVAHMRGEPSIWDARGSPFAQEGHPLKVWKEKEVDTESGGPGVVVLSGDTLYANKEQYLAARRDCELGEDLDV